MRRARSEEGWQGLCGGVVKGVGSGKDGNICNNVDNKNKIKLKVTSGLVYKNEWKFATERKGGNSNRQK